MLFNIYPDKEIYFVHANSHVATGIKVGSKTYILDKYLPLTTSDRWHEKWNKAWYSEKNVEKAKGTFLEPVPLKSILLNTCGTKLDTHKLESEILSRLGIQRSEDYSDNGEGSYFKILQLKKGAILYEDDEIVNYSLAQRLRTIISEEMIDINHIANVKIDRKKNDLIFRVRLND